MIGMTDVALLDWLGRTLHASEGQSREDSQELYRLIAARLRGEAQAEQAVAGEAGTMPGTDGFTMACFKANDVPVGTPLYTRPQAALSSTAAPVEAKSPWIPYLTDRADGVPGHYAISRWNPAGYREVWSLRSHRWASASDEVLTREQAENLLRNIHIPTAAPAADEVAGLKAVIERDRTVFCGLIVQLKAVLQSRSWLSDEHARSMGGYAYDEPGFIAEFGAAWTEIMSALERAHRVFQDFTDCPKEADAVSSAQSEAVTILAAAPAPVAGDAVRSHMEALYRALAAIGIVGVIDEYDVIRRSSVLDIVRRYTYGPHALAQDRTSQAGAPSAPVGVESEPGAVRSLVAAANAVLALYPGDDQMWTLESAVRPFNAKKPAECADGCPPQQVCDYCQIAALAQQPAAVGEDMREEVDALIRLVEGPGCLRWQDGQGFRLKDTPEWVAFYVAAKNALAQQPAACPRCDGTGEADSGGIHPWGAPAMIPCECQQPAAVNEAMVERALAAYLRRQEDGESLYGCVTAALTAALAQDRASQAGAPVGVPAGWSGWATQYRGKMPKLWGAREIAELNYYPGEGARLIFLQEVAAPSPDAEREVGHVG